MADTPTDTQAASDADDAPLPTPNEILQSFDAQVWARVFVRYVKANPSIPTDEGTMLSWFAGALMRGYDEYAGRYHDVPPMPDAPKPESRLQDALAQNHREQDAAEPAGEGYTGQPCATCGRIRVYLRRDGRLICEKCESFQPITPSPDV